MAQNQTPQQTNYVQGYSAPTLRTHGSRTATSDAAFLLPHLAALKPGARVLDVGCGPGSITTSLAQHMPSGSSILGIDLSAEVLAIARQRAAAAQGENPTNVEVTFAQADVLQGLPFADGTFDVVFASQLFPHMKPAEGQPETAMREIRRVLKPNGHGVLATRDAMSLQFFPAGQGMERFERALCRSVARPHMPGGEMPALCRRAGFDVDGGAERFRVGVGSAVTGPGRRAVREFADGFRARLAEGDAFRRGWESAGVPVEEIEEIRRLWDVWAETEDAWMVISQCEVLAWT